MQKPRIGFVGVGSMGQAAHLRNYATLPDCELARAVAVHYGVPAVYQRAEDMLAREQLDGIVAIQPFDHHGQVITPLYQAGIPILTEKPLAASFQVGERMLTALHGSTSWHMVGYNKRSDPATMYVRQEIERLRQSGELGPLRYVRITIPEGDWMVNGFFDLIRTDEAYPQEAGDPAPDDIDAATYQRYWEFVNYFIHQVNLLRYLLGEPYSVTYAEPSGVLLGARSQSGVACVIEMSPYKTTLDWQESALVGFEHGYIQLDLPAPLVLNRPGRVEIFRDPGKGVVPQTLVPQLPWVHSMRQQAINFVRAIKGEAKPPCEAAEALEDLKIAREYIRLLRGV